MEMVIFHIVLSVILFFIVNWVGKHAVEFGYASTTLFEDASDSVALNLFIRSLSPTVFIIAISAALVAAGYPDLRIGIVWVSVYYFIFRALVIFTLNRQNLVRWPQYFMQAGVGIAAAWLAYQHLILPIRSLIPDLDEAGNELWLAIFAFLYAVANKVQLSGGPGIRRRNAFVTQHYRDAVYRFGTLVDKKIEEESLRLVAYSIIIYEDYCRPPFIRMAERAAFWKEKKTTGIMQVTASAALSDLESVDRGTSVLLDSWQRNFPIHDSKYGVARAVISEYNKDENYIDNIFKVMEILAIRVEPNFQETYEGLFKTNNDGEFQSS